MAEQKFRRVEEKVEKKNKKKESGPRHLGKKAMRMAYRASDKRTENKVRRLIRLVRRHPNDVTAAGRLKELRREYPGAFRKANSQLTANRLAA